MFALCFACFALVEKRLSEAKLTPVNESIWCSKDDSFGGWSEQILSRKIKFANLEVRRFPVAAVILRPPKVPLCMPIHTEFHIPWAKHAKNLVPYAACKAAAYGFGKNLTGHEILSTRPFRLRGRKNKDSESCLSVGHNDSNPETMPCQNPIPPHQLFFTTPNAMILFGWNTTTEEWIAIDVQWSDLESSWVKEPYELYGMKTLERAVK